MISESMTQLVQGNSVIRALFEEGREMARKWGRKMFMISVWGIRAFLLRRLCGYP